jgi:hypothetical protein
MPNWAELHEISRAVKATHAQVDYRQGTKDEHCGNCRNFIPDAEENRCRTVQCPIASPKWCRRYQPE